MAAEASKIKTKLSNLDASLSDLESQLEPIFSQSLPETIIGLEPIQQAKLQTVLPYLVYDLVFSGLTSSIDAPRFTWLPVYLKAKGVDPKTHSVVAELDRVRQYFDKIAKAENPPIRRTEMDQDAAGRFIKHAISGVTIRPNTAIPVDVPSRPISLPVKMTTKMIARAQYERALEKERHEKHDDEGGLQVYDGHGSDSSTSDGGDIHLSEPITEDIPTPSTSSKRQRPPVDPFADSRESSRPSKKSKKDSTDSDYVASSPGLENRRGEKKKKVKKPL